MNQKGFALIWMLILLFLIMGILAWVIYHGESSSYQFFQQPLTQEVQKSTPSPNIVETANWKAYTDPNQQFSFNYPGDWIIQDNPSLHSSPRFQSPDFDAGYTESTGKKGNYIVITFDKAAGSLDDGLRNWQKPADKTGVGSTSLVSVEKIKLNNEDALKIKTSGPLDLLRFELIKNGIEFNVICAYNSKNAESLIVCDNVSASFKFTN